MGEVAGIVAVARNGVIGAAGGIPWRLTGDLPRLKALTMGQVLIMGRRTWDSIGRVLPGRVSIVVSRDPYWAAEGALLAHSVPDALDRAREVAPDAIWWVFGGGEIYRQAWDLVTRWEVTEVHAEPEGDTFFPSLDPDEWEEEFREPRDGFDFVSYRRRAKMFGADLSSVRLAD